MWNLFASFIAFIVLAMYQDAAQVRLLAAHLFFLHLCTTALNLPSWAGKNKSKALQAFCVCAIACLVMFSFLTTLHDHLQHARVSRPESYSSLANHVCLNLPPSKLNYVNGKIVGTSCTVRLTEYLALDSPRVTGLWQITGLLMRLTKIGGLGCAWKSMPATAFAISAIKVLLAISTSVTNGCGAIRTIAWNGCDTLVGAISTSVTNGCGAIRTIAWNGCDTLVGAISTSVTNGWESICTFAWNGCDTFGAFVGSIGEWISEHKAIMGTSIQECIATQIYRIDTIREAIGTWLYWSCYLLALLLHFFLLGLEKLDKVPKKEWVENLCRLHAALWKDAKRSTTFIFAELLPTIAAGVHESLGFSMWQYVVALVVCLYISASLYYTVAVIGDSLGPVLDDFYCHALLAFVVFSLVLASSLADTVRELRDAESDNALKQVQATTQATTIAVRDKTIVEQDTTIAEQDDTIADQDTTIADQRAALATRATIITTQAAFITTQATTIANRDATVSTQATTLADQARKIAELFGLVGSNTADLLSKKDSTIEDLRRDLVKANNNAATQLSAFNKLKEEEIKRVENLKASLTSETKAKDSAVKSNSELEGTIGNFQKEVARLESELEKEKKAREAKETELNSANSNFSSNSDVVRQQLLQQFQKERDTEIQKVKDEASKYNSLCQQADNEYKSLQQQASEIQRQLDVSNGRIREVEQSIQTYEVAATADKQTIQELQKNSDEAANANNPNEQTVQQLRQEVGRLEAAAAADKASIEEYKESLMKTRGDLVKAKANLTTEKNNHNMEKNNLTNERDDLTSEMDGLEDDKYELMTEKEALQNNIKTVLATVNKSPHYKWLVVKDHDPENFTSHSTSWDEQIKVNNGEFVTDVEYDGPFEQVVYGDGEYGEGIFWVAVTNETGSTGLIPLDVISLILDESVNELEDLDVVQKSESLPEDERVASVEVFNSLPIGDDRELLLSAVGISSAEDDIEWAPLDNKYGLPVINDFDFDACPVLNIKHFFSHLQQWPKHDRVVKAFCSAYNRLPDPRDRKDLYQGKDGLIETKFSLVSLIQQICDWGPPDQKEDWDYKTLQNTLEELPAQWG